MQPRDVGRRDQWELQTTDGDGWVEVCRRIWPTALERHNSHLVAVFNEAVGKDGGHDLDAPETGIGSVQE